MEKLYYHMPYIKEFEAVVLSCSEGKKGFEVLLDKTGFYPEGGGQPYDTGELGGVRVLEVHEKEGRIIHYTDGPLLPGSLVKGIINWQERFSNMQQHSGEHIVSGLIHSRYGYDNVGFHMGKEEMTIDLNGVLTWEQLMEIEREANQVVFENKPIFAAYPSEEELKTITYRSKKELTGMVRIVEVPGADICACCGTHVERTGEIGIIKFLSMIHYKGGVRISMLCGKKALEDYEKKTEQAIRISNLLSAKMDKLTEAVERMKEENTEKDARMGSLTRQLLLLKADSYKEGEEALLIFEEELAPAQIRQFCDLLLEQKKAPVVAVCSGNEEEGYSYCIGSRSADMKQLGKNLNEALNGRGGGKKQMMQGTFKASKALIEEVFRKETDVWN